MHVNMPEKGRWTISNKYVLDKRPSFIPEIKELPLSPRTRGWQTHSPKAVTLGNILQLHLTHDVTCPETIAQVYLSIPALFQSTILLATRPSSFIGLKKHPMQLYENAHTSLSEPDHRKFLRNCSVCFNILGQYKVHRPETCILNSKQNCFDYLKPPSIGKGPVLLLAQLVILAVTLSMRGKQSTAESCGCIWPFYDLNGQRGQYYSELAYSGFS